MNQSILIKDMQLSDDLTIVQNLHKQIWKLTDIDVTPTHIYQAVLTNGGKLLVVFVNETPVGFAFGFYGTTINYGNYFYCHNLGILETFRDDGLGKLLITSLAQKVRECGINLIRWTFDPLDSRNANLYIHKLGGISYFFEIDHYKEMSDGLNKNLPGNRLLVDWELNKGNIVKSETENHLKERNVPSQSLIINQVKINAKAELVPEPFRFDFSNIDRQRSYFVQIPSNMEMLKEHCFSLAKQWYLHIGEAFSKCFEANLFIADTLFIDKQFFYEFRSK